jgi:hypothetical protein
MDTPHTVDVIAGDLFQARAQSLANAINCVGVMGKGIALEFKKRFPIVYEDYLERCKRDEVKLGRPYLYRNPQPPHVLNFPTKDHWRSASRLNDIVSGLEYLEAHYREWGITSLASRPSAAVTEVSPTITTNLLRPLGNRMACAWWPCWPAAVRIAGFWSRVAEGG